MALTLLSVGLAALLGFAAHRGSICTVRAVAEVMHTGHTYMLRSIVKSILWALAVTIPIIWLSPTAHNGMTGWRFSTAALFGGFVYGMGTAVNGGCAFSTLNQLVNGKLRMLGTLIAFCLGALIDLAALHAGFLSPPVAASPFLDRFLPWAPVIIAALAFWGLLEIRRILRTRPFGSSFIALLLSERYRLSTTAALMGLCSGVLYLIYGSWSYTSTVTRTVEGLVAMSTWPWPILWILFGAMLTGMMLSTWQRRSFRIEWRPTLGWLRNLVGGVLMGMGAVLVPGGNDVLVLSGIPNLSPHAFPAYLAMLVGIAAGLLAMRRLTGLSMTVTCGGDICVIREVVARS